MDNVTGTNLHTFDRCQLHCKFCQTSTPLFSIVSCSSCGDSTHDNGVGEVLCAFCLMILDNSLNWKQFETTKSKYGQPAIMLEDNRPTSSVEDEFGLPISDSKPKCQSKNKKSLCEVCGASASGLHFGVFTCEGCKCFYRRTIKEGANYVCPKSNSCSVTMETRNSCRYCRFQKCMALGMCKEGIKLGRRPKADSGLHYSTHLKMERDGPEGPENTMYVPRWHSWPTVCTTSNHQLPMKQEPISTRQVQSCSGYSTPHPSYKQETFSYCRQKTTIVQNDEIIHQSFNNLSTDILWNDPQPFPTGYQNSSQVNYSSIACHHIPSQSIAPSLSMTLPEVHTGAFTAMAYANMYRGQYIHDSSGNYKNVQNIKSEDSGEVKFTELKPFIRKSRIASETNIISSTPSNYCETLEQEKQNQMQTSSHVSMLSTENSLKRKKTIENDSNNTKIPRMNHSEKLSSEGFVKVYENLEKLIVEEWTSSLKSSGNMSEVLNPPKSSMPNVKLCFKTFAESITEYKCFNSLNDVQVTICPYHR
ncbi:steroid receptor seven-up-like [Anneissia japonica]|uniref:steroid receptor seven-up-like n=1 Tax=Anneissia japonica TaxID=1529436 RepID=UPI001425604E|nr:steroid receptor seven-up-like [Anneissia japonica]